MRESEGVYRFGARRIYVRLDNDRINIRVGGGYLPIDEFLDQYTPVEDKRVERMVPIKKAKSRGRASVGERAGAAVNLAVSKAIADKSTTAVTCPSTALASLPSESSPIALSIQIDDVTL